MTIRIRKYPTKISGLCALALTTAGLTACAPAPEIETAKIHASKMQTSEVIDVNQPNILMLFADDLGCRIGGTCYQVPPS